MLRPTASRPAPPYDGTTAPKRQTKVAQKGVPVNLCRCCVQNTVVHLHGCREQVCLETGNGKARCLPTLSRGGASMHSEVFSSAALAPVHPLTTGSMGYWSRATNRRRAQRRQRRRQCLGSHTGSEGELSPWNLRPEWPRPGRSQSSCSQSRHRRTQGHSGHPRHDGQRAHSREAIKQTQLAAQRSHLLPPHHHDHASSDRSIRSYSRFFSSSGS